MADNLDDDFYVSDDESPTLIPENILEDTEEHINEDIINEEIIEIKTMGHSIHPDRMTIPTLKRHADEVILAEVEATAVVTKKQKKAKLEDPVPVTREEQLALLMKLYAKYKKPTSLETDNITSLTVENILDTSQFTGSLQSSIQACKQNVNLKLIKSYSQLGKSAMQEIQQAQRSSSCNCPHYICCSMH